MTALHLLACLAFAAIGTSADGRELAPAGPQIALAQQLEAGGDAAAARAAWERVIDSCSVTGEEVRLAVAHVGALNPRVPPNTDPAKANVWRAKAFIFRTFDFTWRPKDAEADTHVTITTTDEDIALLKAGFQRFAELVFEYSRGELRLEYEVEVIEEPLTRISGEGSFWLGPWDVANLIEGRYEPGKLDSVFAYVKMGDGKDQKCPPAMFGGTFGGDYGPDGAGWTGIMWWPGWMKGDGEVELHEWLHQVDWAFAARLRYPNQVVPGSDDGRREGESGGDLCYRRQPDETNWLRFYRHLMSEHITSRMWQEVRCRPWEGVTYARDWLVAGPFPYEGPIDRALEQLPWEPGHAPSEGDLVNGEPWSVCRSERDYIDLDARFGGADNAFACAAATVRSDRDREATLGLGYDDSIVVYLNGEEVARHIGPSGAQKDALSAPVHLRKGDNLVLLKIADINGGWGFYVRLGDELGRAIEGVEWPPAHF